MKHILYATKDLFPIDAPKNAKPLVKAGEVAATIDTPLELDRVVNSCSNGMLSLDKPKPAQAVPDKAADKIASKPAAIPEK
jgi:hypothetical protein